MQLIEQLDIVLLDLGLFDFLFQVFLVFLQLVDVVLLNLPEQLFTFILLVKLALLLKVLVLPLQLCNILLLNLNYLRLVLQLALNYLLMQSLQLLLAILIIGAQLLNQSICIAQLSLQFVLNVLTLTQTLHLVLQFSNHFVLQLSEQLFPIVPLQHTYGMPHLLLHCNVG